MTVGRRYGVAASGTGVQLRGAPDPNAPPVESLRFATVVAITAEASGADGKTWRRVDNRGWASRDGLFVFTNLRDTMNLAIELRVYSSPTVRASLSAYERPVLPAASPTGPVPGKTQATSTRPDPVTPVYYGVVVKPRAIEFDQPGDTLRKSAPLEISFTTTIVSDGIGADGLRYNRLENDAWVRSDLMAVFGSLPGATGEAYRATMEALAPGIEIHPNIAPALWLLHREVEFRYLADTIRDAKIPIRIARITDPAIIGLYHFAERTITFSERSHSLDVRVLAATLAHEANHAWEFKQGVPFVHGAPCLEAELRAFRIQSNVWEKFFGEKGKEVPSNDAEKEQNEIVRLFRHDSEVLKSRMLSRYAEQCGYHGPLPASVSIDLTPRTDATPNISGPVTNNSAPRQGQGGSPVIVGQPGAGTPVPGLFGNSPVGAQPGLSNPDGAVVPGQPPVSNAPPAPWQQTGVPGKIPETTRPLPDKPAEIAKPPANP